ncbi:MAG: YdeI/OmpD-associated family protein [Actinobacteria bacterium]|nr:YdeI/OmpD-associated family protein [Actinomycetota bacterium]
MRATHASRGDRTRRLRDRGHPRRRRERLNASPASHPGAEPEQTKAGRPIVAFASAGEWDSWLATNHDASPGIWLRFAKKASGVATVSPSDAIDIALTMGWIDGQKAAFDATYWLVKFTPRRKRSVWSKINRERVARLLADGRMRPSGIAAVDDARADGRWDRAYEPASRATVPDDLRAALDNNPRASAFFATLDAANRYAILHRVQDAKRPETRERRVATFVEMLARGETLHPRRGQAG